eukprot:TRINITY_DN2513_c0_g1::TRINITY_DN2513_c0_g1_i1::g.19169::m.19169 TRINITY_DN2513_c0_g1::TRINITY_DN2513_c0_g1_i1::g.19169  ORF type:complete len:771 (+),score=242.83,sp/P48506/GSH1_HUMAN/46.50/0.0,GCS/PF03074.11/2.4e-144,GCS2/PF04107.8/0.034 TRINITY_DN2513_c0_g1_i1:139-2451(+)
MGLLTVGTPLDWEDSKQYHEHVRKHGIEQFLHIYRNCLDRKKDCLMWGDEVEYTVVAKTETGTKVSLRAPEMLQLLMEDEQKNGRAHVLWRPEYANWMVEGTPGDPYRCYVTDLLLVEPSMCLRRKLVEQILLPNECLTTLCVFPRLGCENFTEPALPPGGPYSESSFVPDASINPHPRFGTLTRNIRKRRGEKVNIRLPLFRDEKTPETIPSYPEVGGEAVPAKDVHMDCMAFGMGSCCLQVTLQCRDIAEARNLYDQLAVLGPIMLAVSAAAPIWRGYLVDMDVRWNVIGQSVDDRTKDERTLPVEAGKGGVRTSRYSTIDCFINDAEWLDDAKYNDVPIIVNDMYYPYLVSQGIDARLARHISHLFIRDPLVIFENTLHQDDAHQADHFENLQSTNWNSVRFKPPPPNSDIGWRVEFRTMDIQLTDFENAALAIFIVLASRVIIAFDLNLYIPISKIDENMERAHKRGACKTEKFWFRRSPVNSYSFLPDGFKCVCGKQHSPQHNLKFSSGSPDKWVEMTVDEIMNGTDMWSADHSEQHTYPGLIPLIHTYLDSIGCVGKTRLLINNYLDLVRLRASGELMTDAEFIRKFVHSHPEYNTDSVVSQKIQDDLIDYVDKLAHCKTHAPELFKQERRFDCCNIPPACCAIKNPWDHEAHRKGSEINGRMSQLLAGREPSDVDHEVAQASANSANGTGTGTGSGGPSSPCTARTMSPVLLGSSLKRMNTGGDVAAQVAAELAAAGLSPSSCSPACTPSNCSPSRTPPCSSP